MKFLLTIHWKKKRIRILLASIGLSQVVSLLNVSGMAGGGLIVIGTCLVELDVDQVIEN